MTEPINLRTQIAAIIETSLIGGIIALEGPEAVARRIVKLLDLEEVDRSGLQRLGEGLIDRGYQPTGNGIWADALGALDTVIDSRDHAEQLREAHFEAGQQARTEAAEHKRVRGEYFEALSEYRFIVAGLLGWSDSAPGPFPTDETLHDAIEAAFRERDEAGAALLERDVKAPAEAPVAPLTDLEDETVERVPENETVEWWNAHVPVGTLVTRWPYRDANGLAGTPVKTRTRSEAWALGHGTAVVSVEDHTGGIPLWALTPCPEDAPPAPSPVDEVRLAQARELLEVQGRSGNWDYDRYMHGMYNGMELVLALFEGGREPEFRDAPPGWLRDRTTR